MPAQRVLEQAFRLDQEVLVDGTRQVRVARHQVDQRLPALGGEPRGGHLCPDEADVFAGGRRSLVLVRGDGAAGDVGAAEVQVEGALAVHLPEQRLGLVAALPGLDAPKVDPGAVPLCGLHGGDQVLVATDQRGVADGAVPGERFEVGADEGVDALLLVVGVEVAEPHLDVRQFGDGLLLGRVGAAAGAVVPVDAEQPAVREDRARLFDERLDQPAGVEVEGAAVLGAGDQETGCGVHVPRVDEDRVGGGSFRDLGEDTLEELVRQVQAVADLVRGGGGIGVAHAELCVRGGVTTCGYLDIQKISLA